VAPEIDAAVTGLGETPIDHKNEVFELLGRPECRAFTVELYDPGLDLPVLLPFSSLCLRIGSPLSGFPTG
jgi:hypothetical protein